MTSTRSTRISTSTSPAQHDSRGRAPGVVNRGGPADRAPRPSRAAAAGRAARAEPRARRDGDVPADVRQATSPRAAAAQHAALCPRPRACRRRPWATTTCRRSACRGSPQMAFAPMPPTPSGYVPGAPIITIGRPARGPDAPAAGQSDFAVGGAQVAFSGIPDGLHNVLRDLKESPLGAKANQLESMTIEMVAMLFDFIFETKDLPDGIKALLARLQIPVLKAAMLDGAFFAKKTHPARLLVNELAQAGLGWSPVMGSDDPLYRKIDAIVHAILDGFSDDLTHLRRAARGAREVPRRGGGGGRAQHPVEAPRRSRSATASEIASVVAQGGDREAHRGERGPQLPRAVPAPEMAGRARERLSGAGRGERRRGAPASPRSRSSCGACSPSARRRTGGTSWRCCRRC